jgi:hypothetical protein
MGCIAQILKRLVIASDLLAVFTYVCNAPACVHMSCVCRTCLREHTRTLQIIEHTRTLQIIERLAGSHASAANTPGASETARSAVTRGHPGAAQPSATPPTTSAAGQAALRGCVRSVFNSQGVALGGALEDNIVRMVGASFHTITHTCARAHTHARECVRTC